MDKKSQDLCPCYSQQKYEDCCRPYHLGANPLNALQLMRSRYSAYAMNLIEYIIQTTHPLSTHYQHDIKSWKKSIGNFSNNTKFTGLDIHNFQEKKDYSVVVFTAYISEKGKETTFTESSLFQKVQDRWLYLQGKTKEGKDLSLIAYKHLTNFM